MTTTKTKTPQEPNKLTVNQKITRSTGTNYMEGLTEVISNEPVPVWPKSTAPDNGIQISADSPLADIIKFVLTKCTATLAEDIDNLTPKDRIMLWKEYGNYFEPEEVKMSQVPGANIKEVTVNILHNGE